MYDTDNSREKSTFERIFRKITTLSLHDCLLNWPEIVSIASQFTSLAILLLGNNGLTSLAGSSDLSTTITAINLESNDFTALSSISPLTKFPNLRKLILKNNAIAAIAEPAAPKPVFAASLSDVDLSHNAIDSWAFIDALQSAFPGLTALRLSHNPLFKSLTAPGVGGRPLSADDGYTLAIARLPALATLNFSPVAPKDRLNAESYYLSSIAAELGAAPAADEQAILATHPRWHALCDEYGEPPVKRVDGAVNPNSLAAQLQRFRFCVAVTDGAAPTWETELPRALSVYAVMGVAGRHFGAPPPKLRLVWETGEWEFAAPRGRGYQAESAEDGWWDSDDEDEDMAAGGGARVPREVELVAGTRSIGTWVDGELVNIRVELLE